MRILELTLDAADLHPLYEFYAGDLGLPVMARSAGTLVLRAGASTLAFSRGANPANYHFAFNVHPARFERARAALAAIVPLLQDADGQEVFEFRSWDARSCYFFDPAGNIVEIIARRALAAQPVPPGLAVLSVSEVGMVSEDVPALTARITRELGLPVYKESAGDAFAAMGDASGLLILAQRGRIWYPDSGKPATVASIRCTLDIDSSRYSVDGPPFRFTLSSG